MNGFRNSSRNGQVWRWQRAGGQAVILDGSRGCLCNSPNRLAVVCSEKG